MRINNFIEDMEKMLPCKVAYYPEDKQVLVFINVNNKDCKLCYDEEFIEINWPYNVFCVVEDDLFSIGLDIDITGRI